MDHESYFKSTVGRKQIMAVAGLALAGFVLAHALGNMLVFLGPDSYNKYGHAIVSNPLIYLAEAGLVVFFVGHIVFGTILTLRNLCSRKTRYAKEPSGQKSTSKTTKTMMLQGIILFVFVVFHIITFKYGPYYETTIQGEVMRDLFRLMYEVFQSSLYVFGYIFALTILCFHLSHGVYSALQTLGINRPNFSEKAKKISLLYGVAVLSMFVSQPLYLYFFYKA